MVLWIDEGKLDPKQANVAVGPDPKKVDEQGRFIIEKRDARLRLAVYDFPPNKIDSVSWGVKGEKLQPLAKPPREEYSADFSPVLTKAGEYNIPFVLRTADQEN